MALLVLAHVDAHHGALVVEHELRERAGELGLPHAGRAEEDERADRAAGILQPGARAAQRVRNGGDGLLLADHPLVQALLHANQLRGLALEQAIDRDARPAARRSARCRPRRPLPSPSGSRRSIAVALGELLLERGDLAVADLGDTLQVALALGALGLHPQLVDAAGRVLDALE